MKHFFAISFFVLVLPMVAFAQDEPFVTAIGEGERFTIETKEKNTAASKGLKIEKKLTTRLPNGYRAVVSASQKEDIYSLQKEYGALIELLKLRIELLETELNTKIDSVLDDTQKKTLRADGSLVSEKKKATKKTEPKQ